MNDPEHSPALPIYHKIPRRHVNTPRLVHDSFDIAVAKMQHPFAKIVWISSYGLSVESSSAKLAYSNYESHMMHSLIGDFYPCR